MKGEKSGSKEEKKAKPSANTGKAAEKQKEGVKGSSHLYIAVVAILILAIAGAAIFVFHLFGNITGVSFASFKQNFDSASRVAFVVYNSTNATNLYACSTLSIETLSRPDLRIDYIVIENSTSCIYSPIVYGSGINITNTTSSRCMSIANSEPSVSLSYSTFNKTVIEPDRIYIDADSAYLQECPIAVELS